MKTLAKLVFYEEHGYARIELGEGNDIDENLRTLRREFEFSFTAAELKGDKDD